MTQLRAILMAVIVGLLPAIGLLLPAAAQTAEVMVSGDACNQAGLVEAIMTVDDGGKVTFDCADPQIDITRTIMIINTITIDGSNAAGEQIVLDGGYDGSVGSGNQILNVDLIGNLTLRHLTLQHGEGISNGGAIHNDGTLTIRQSSFSNNNSAGTGGTISNYGTLTINQSSFANNAAEYGGAIANGGGTLKIHQSSFSNNSASNFGGVIYNAEDATVTITQSSFTENSADGGGAIGNYGTLTISQSSFTENSTVYNGGAIQNYDAGTLTITQSSFSNNIASVDRGGAIDNFGKVTITQSSFSNNSAGYRGGAVWSLGDLTIHRSSFVTNHAAGWGGAIAAPATSLTLTASTLSGNTVDFQASAIYAGADLTEASIRWSTIVQPANTSPALRLFTSVTLKGVILAGPGPNCVFDGGTTTDSYTLSDDESCQLDTSAGSQVVPEVDVPATPSTQDTNGVTQTYYTLAVTSPAVDAGGDGCAIIPEGEPGPAVDQLGTVRPQGNACDIGATELQLAEPVDLCANRWDGSLRMPSTSRCASTETMLNLPDDAPLTLCANRWTGEARYSPFGRCRSTETAREANGTDSVSVCINRWTGELRIDNRCYNTERNDKL